MVMVILGLLRGQKNIGGKAGATSSLLLSPSSKILAGAALFDNV
jgi:hypothetical protein